MKKIMLLCLMTLLLTSCTIVRIDTTSIDNIVNVVLSKDNTLYNRVGIGYKYYVPRGMTYIDSTGSNDELYSNGIYYYLYLDEVSYYYKKAINYKEDSTKFYSKKINKGTKGYLEITKQGNLYLIEFVYNYAKVETLVPKKEINNAVLNCSYILSTIKYNHNIIKLSLSENFLQNKEETYDEFSSKQNEEDNDNFLKYEDQK